MSDVKTHIKPEFAFHKLNPQGQEIAKAMAEKFDNLMDYIESVSVQGRELSITLTKLEEACFFAKKAMATNLANQETSP